MGLPEEQQRMLVWIDCDGPLADILQPTLRVVNTHREAKDLPLLRKADVTDWDLFTCLNLSLIEELAVDQLWGEKGFCTRLPVVQGAKEALEELQTFCDVRIATTLHPDSPTWARDRLDWLREHFSIEPEKVVFLQDKSVLQGDLLIDDKPAHIEAANIPALLYKMPYSPQGKKAHTWPELVDIVRRLNDSFQGAPTV